MTAQGLTIQGLTIQRLTIQKGIYAEAQIPFLSQVIGRLLRIHSLAGGDGNHLVDVVHRAASAQVVHRTGYSLKDRADCISISQTLHEFVTDISHLEVRCHKHVSLACNLVARSLLATNLRHESSISLQFSVNLERRVKFLGQCGGLHNLVHHLVLCGTLGGE